MNVLGVRLFHSVIYLPLEDRNVGEQERVSRIVENPPQHNLLKQFTFGKELDVVMVSHNQTLITVQSWVDVVCIVLLASKGNITEVIYFILWLDGFIPIIDQYLIHLFCVVKQRSTRRGVLQDVGMLEVCI